MSPKSVIGLKVMAFPMATGFGATPTELSEVSCCSVVVTKDDNLKTLRGVGLTELLREAIFNNGAGTASNSVPPR